MKLIRGMRYIVKKGNDNFNTGETFDINDDSYLYAYGFIAPSEIDDALEGCEYEPDLEWCKARKKVLMDELDILSGVIYGNQ